MASRACSCDRKAEGKCLNLSKVADRNYVKGSTKVEERSGG